MGKKSKKEKARYIDDGRTIADMSSLGGSQLPRLQRSSLKEQAKTYFTTVKMMLVPMFIVIGIICVAFGILWLLLAIASA